MGEGFARSRTMPVLGVGGNAHGFACLEFLGLLAFDLVVASAAHGDEYLGSTVVDVPVVAASRLEGDVVDGKFRSVEHRREIALTYKILGKAVVRLSHGKCAWIFHNGPFVVIRVH